MQRAIGVWLNAKRLDPAAAQANIDIDDRDIRPKTIHQIANLDFPAGLVFSMRADR